MTLKVTLQLLKSPKDMHEKLFFSKLQLNSFFLVTPVSCSESTLPVYGFGSKIALTCEMTFSSAFSYFSKASDLWPVLSRINLLLTPALNRVDAHVTRRQWAVFRLSPAALHRSGKISFKVFIPTGHLSNENFFAFGLK